ncbi:MAG: hypothetical protein IM456_13140 [Microcystis sp. M079S1]|uniref:hypothetical protein n=1 Tax=Microcystis sp. M114S2 TaxID=2771140 RepID=UPI00258430EF|nr:hypothetical protein [Microcystis sp. M114S2]MCA2842987.1 hypothetical protein [Microcystis sp. M079S1]MCA2845013.1 hypothetical protein [Microcystis sp. M074S1]
MVKTNRRVVKNYPLVKIRYGGDRVIGFCLIDDEMKSVAIELWGSIDGRRL